MAIRNTPAQYKSVDEIVSATLLAKMVCLALGYVGGDFAGDFLREL